MTRPNEQSLTNFEIDIENIAIGMYVACRYGNLYYNNNCIQLYSRYYSIIILFVTYNIVVVIHVV